MSATLTTGLVIIVAVFILAVFSTILPYWAYYVKAGVTYHDGLWRNCTVYPDKFDCSNVKDGKPTFFIFIQKKDNSSRILLTAHIEMILAFQSYQLGLLRLASEKG